MVVFFARCHQAVHNRTTETCIGAPSALPRQSYPDWGMICRMNFIKSIIIHTSIFELEIKDVIGGSKKMFTPEDV